MVFSHSWQKKSKKRRLDNESFIFPALSADEMLDKKKFQALFKRLRSHTAVEQEVFDALYLELVRNFVEFVQAFPYRANPDLFHFNVALTRAYQMVEKIHQQLKRTNNDLDLYQQQRVLFAVFSGALLNDIGSIDRDRIISVTEENGYFIQNWHPMAHGAMAAGGFYRLRFARHKTDRYAYDQCAILARLIMPDAAMVWLSEDPTLFAAWIRSLHHFDEGFSDFIFGNELKELWESVNGQDEFGVVLSEGKEATELAQGEAFWQFMLEHLEKGQFKANEEGAHVFGLDDGCVFDLDKVFYDFQKTYPQYRDWVVVQRQFNHLGVVPQSGYDLRYAQYFQVNQNAASQNAALKNSSALSMYHRKSEAKKQNMLKNTVTMSNIYMFVNPSASVPKTDQVVQKSSSGLFSKLMRGLLKGLVLTGIKNLAVKGGR